MKDAVKEIEQNLDVDKILKHYKIDEYNEGESPIRMRCPLPDHDSHDPTAFVINSDTGTWTCHTQCGNGSIFHLIQEMEKVNFIKAVDILCGILGIDDAEVKQVEPYIMEARKFVRKNKKEKIEFEPWSNEFRPIRLQSYRNFTEETIKHFKAGYLEKGKGISKKGKLFDLNKKVVIPLFHKDELIGCSFRRTDPGDKIKWLHYPAKLQTSNLLYNLDSCKEFDHIIITEGIFDVWSFYQAGIRNAVCTFGAHLTDEQYKLLMRSGKDVVLAYDNDQAGQEATIKAKQKLANKVQLNQIVFSTGKDPGDYTSKELLKLYDERVRI